MKSKKGENLYIILEGQYPKIKMLACDVPILRRLNPGFGGHCAWSYFSLHTDFFPSNCLLLKSLVIMTLVNNLEHILIQNYPLLGNFAKSLFPSKVRS